MAEQEIAAVGNEVEVLVEGNSDNQVALSLNIDTQPMIALQPFVETEELVIQTTEDGLDESQEVPAVGEEHEIASVPSSPKEKKRKGKSSKGKSGQGSGKKAFKRSLQAADDDGSRNEVDKPRKWERKKVQIKTLEGEFAVTMWASGRPCTIILSVVCIESGESSVICVYRNFNVAKYIFRNVKFEFIVR